MPVRCGLPDTSSRTGPGRPTARDRRQASYATSAPMLCPNHAYGRSSNGSSAVGPWAYPMDRYYYDWYGEPPMLPEPTDGDIKAEVVDRLRDNPRTKDDDIRVDVAQAVVVLGGEVSSTLAKRAAGDDAWDTPGVVDVSNQLRMRRN